MTSLQQEPSAQRPWAKTIVGFADAGISLSVFAAGAAGPGRLRPRQPLVAGFAPTPQELRQSMRRAIHRPRGAELGLGLRAASQLHSPGGSETEGVSLAASERRPGQLPLRRAFCLLAGLLSPRPLVDLGLAAGPSGAGSALGPRRASQAPRAVCPHALFSAIASNRRRRIEQGGEQARQHPTQPGGAPRSAWAQTGPARAARPNPDLAQAISSEREFSTHPRGSVSA